MKLQGRAARDWLREPKGTARLVLISGADPVRVDQARARVLEAWVGPEAAAEMRLDRISAAELRGDPARLLDAVKAIGFFGGARAVWVEDATDGLAPRLAEALDAWADGDARIVATAGALTAKGALRTLAEARKDAVALTLYDDPPTAADIAADLSEAGLRPDVDARAALATWTAALPPGEWAGLIERLRLHQWDEPEGTLSVEVVDALAPQALEADADEVVAALARRDPGALALALRRAYAQRVTPVSIVIAALRAARTSARSADTGSGAWSPRARFGDAWPVESLDQAIRQLLALDLTLRSGGSTPAEALVERELLGLVKR